MKRLVIAPHADDEILGCASVLDADSFVYVVGVEDFDGVDRQGRLEEMETVAKRFGFSLQCGSGVVNRYVLQELIGVFESLINDLKPEELFVPFHGSYNQDHRTVFQAARVATRPHDTNWFVPSVYIYEEPDMLWTHESFRAQFFVPLDLQKKQEGLELHASQMRGHRALDLIAALARVRGEQAAVPHAEAFEVLRVVKRA